MKAVHGYTLLNYKGHECQEVVRQKLMASHHPVLSGPVTSSHSDFYGYIFSSPAFNSLWAGTKL